MFQKFFHYYFDFIHQSCCINPWQSTFKLTRKDFKKRIILSLLERISLCVGFILLFLVWLSFTTKNRTWKLTQKTVLLIELTSLTRAAILGTLWWYYYLKLTSKSLDRLFFMYLEKHKKYRWNFPTQLIIIIMLYYLTPSSGVNFINILRARFLNESALRIFSLAHFGFIFFGKRISAKKVRIKRWWHCHL